MSETGQGAHKGMASVDIKIQDLITLMSSEIARKVSDELRKQHIEPLEAKVAALEIELAKPNKQVDLTNKTITYWKGAVDAAWKTCVIAYVAFNLYLKMRS